MRTLDKEEVETHFATDVEDKTEVNGGAAAAVGGEIPGVDEETGGKDEADGATVDG